MNGLQIFSKEGIGNVRALIYNDNPYFVGVDVARALEYEYPSQAIGNHCKGIVKLTIPSGDGLQERNVIPIGDVCRLIVKAATQSKNANIKEKVEAYELWIFNEVLPDVHNTGTCSIKPNDIPALTVATGYIREIRRAMEQQGSTPQ